MNFETEKLMPEQDLKECPICARLFSSERIDTHEVICQKSSSIQRKSFDITEQRTRWTDAEKLAKAGARNEDPMFQKSSSFGLSTNWREKHKEFINKIQEAKRRASEKNNNKKKINDLPFPPPPLDRKTYYVRCQNCIKQFNEASTCAISPFVPAKCLIRR